MSENQDKPKTSKTLTIKSGTLGIASKGKLGISGVKANTPASSQATPHSKGTVVVVTKARKAEKESNKLKSEQPVSENLDGLTSEEMERRLQVLRLAEHNKKLEQEKLKKQQEKEIEIKQREQEVKKNKETDIAIKESQEEMEREKEKQKLEQQKISKEIETKKRNEELKSLLLSKGRIKNLDNLGVVTPKTSEAETKSSQGEKAHTTAVQEQKSKQDISANKKKTTTTTTTTTFTKKHSKYDGEEDSVGHLVKKPIQDKRANKKLSVSQVMMMEERDEDTSIRSKGFIAAKKPKNKAKTQVDITPKEKVFREVMLPDVISVQELANRMAEKAADVIKTLMKFGVMATLNQSIDADTAELVIVEFGHKVKRVTAEDIEKSLISDIEDTPEELQKRPPVVTVMGHVDHGKTSLLDALHSTDVAAKEAGGITQHIGAYQVKLVDGKFITFLDTPGHEAFTAMRSRGAKSTDIVILVVAADDGIMPQTIEAINHAKAAEVPIIVAINKIDKPEADPSRVKGELLNHELVPEDMGGDTMVVEVSAKAKLNLEQLEESILLQAEMMDLKANPNRLAKGVVVEAKIDKGRGAVATLLIQNGTLKVGDYIVAGTAHGKIKALINDKAQKVSEATPSVPVEILGLNKAPIAGDEFIVTANEKLAKEIAELRINREREKSLITSKKASLEQMFINVQNANYKEFNIIVKADTQGSVEAIVSSLTKLSNEEIHLRPLHTAVGGITESDIALANASRAFVVGFNVRANNLARDLAKQYGIEIRYYSIIYNLLDDVKAAMSGMLAPNVKENITGYAEVKNVFDLSKFGKVAGCYVTEGMIKKNGRLRLIRDNVVIYDGKLKALKRFKDDIKEVKSGFECGISLENYEDIKVEDKIEAYELIEEARTL